MSSSGRILRDHALVAVPAGHLVADRDLPLGGDVHLDHLLHAAGQLVAALQRVELALLLVEQEIQPFLVPAIDFLTLLAPAPASGCPAWSSLKTRACSTIALSSFSWPPASCWCCVSLSSLLVQHAAQLGDQGPELLGNLPGEAVFQLLLLLVEQLLFVLGHAGPPAEPLRVDDDAFDAGRHFQAVVLDVLAGPAEDGVQQLLFRRQLALGLRRHLADQDVARLHEGADADDAVLVQVGQCLGRDVGDVAGELLLAQLRLADFDLELLDVDRGVGVLLRPAVR